MRRPRRVPTCRTRRRRSNATGRAVGGGPFRTCLGCREARPRAALVRLVRSADGTVVVDPRGRMAGRGAWICANASCVERGARRDRLAHAFRKPCRVAPGLDGAIVAAATAVAQGRD